MVLFLQWDAIASCRSTIRADQVIRPRISSLNKKARRIQIPRAYVDFLLAAINVLTADLTQSPQASN